MLPFAILPGTKAERKTHLSLARLSFLFAAPSEFFKASRELWRGPIRCTVALYGSLPDGLTGFFGALLRASVDFSQSRYRFPPA